MQIEDMSATAETRFPIGNSFFVFRRNEDGKFVTNVNDVATQNMFLAIKKRFREVKLVSDADRLKRDMMTEEELDALCNEQIALLKEQHKKEVLDLKKQIKNINDVAIKEAHEMVDAQVKSAHDAEVNELKAKIVLAEKSAKGDGGSSAKVKELTKANEELKKANEELELEKDSILSDKEQFELEVLDLNYKVEKLEEENAELIEKNKSA